MSQLDKLIKYWEKNNYQINSVKDINKIIKEALQNVGFQNEIRKLYEKLPSRQNWKSSLRMTRP